MSDEELFRLAFGRAAPERSRGLTMRVFAEGQALGNADIVYSADFSAFDFSSPRLSRFLDEHLLPGARGKAGDSAGLFNSAALRGAGYAVDADEARFEVRVTLPPEDKVTLRTYLNGYYEAAPAGVELEPARFSFYANYRFDERMTYSARSSSFTGERETFDRGGAVFDFDAAAAVFGWVFEGSGYVREPGERERFTRESFERGDVRLVRDVVPWHGRFSAGDVGISSEILGGEALGGVRYERNGWFFGGDPRDKQNFVRFFMAKAGWLEVYVNGAYSKRVYLPAGHHEVGGFGGEVGRNSVTLVLRGEDGGIEEIPFEYVLDDPRGMGRGEARWSATAGFRREEGAPSPQRYYYISSAPAGHADVLYGLLDWMSVGLAAQGSGENGAAAARALIDMGAFGWADLRGYVSGVGYGRLGRRADVGYTANLRPALARLNRFLTNDFEREVLPQVSLSLRGYYQSSAYSAGLFDLPYEGRAPNAAGFSGNLGLLMFKVNLTATGGVNLAGGTAGVGGYGVSGYTCGARMSYSVGRASFSVSGGADVSGGVRTPYFSASTNYALGFRVKNHRFSASADAGMRMVNIGEREVRVWDTAAGVWRYDTMEAHSENRWMSGVNAGWRWSNNGGGAGAQSYWANAGLRDDGVPAYSAGGQYAHNRAQLALDYSSARYDYTSYTSEVHNVRAVLSGSLMAADGLFALGRQVSNGFVLAAPRGNMSGARLHVNRSHHFRQDFSHSGWLGAAYHNRLTEYSPTQLTLTLTDFQPGAFLEQNRYHALGAYRRGYALRVGGKADVMALVRFTDAGKPVAYAYVTVEPANAKASEQSEKQASFTSGDGVLQAGGLTAGGAYRLKFNPSTYIKDITIEIPKDAAPIIELPDIAVERE